MAKSSGTKENQQKLFKFIDGCIPDKYIDVDEERDIFEFADELEIADSQCEAMVNHRCKRAHCTRETQITWLLEVILEEMTKDDGVIDEGEFDHVIGFGVALRMPRKDAVNISIKLIRENGWKAKGKWLKKLEQNL